MSDTDAPEGSDGGESLSSLAEAFQQDIAAEQNGSQPKNKSQDTAPEEDTDGADASEDAEPEDGEPEGEEAESEEESEEADDDEDPILAVDIDGTEKKYSRKEAAKLIQRAEHYEKKTANLRVERESVDADREAARAERQKYTELVERVTGLLEQKSEFADVDWVKLAEEDPAACQVLWQKKMVHEQLLSRAKEEQGRLTEAETKEFEARKASYANEQHAKLRTKLADVVTPQGADRWTKYFSSKFTPQELTEVNKVPLHHEMVIAFEKARRYDEAQQKGKDAAKQPNQAPKMLKPGAGKGPGQRQSERTVALDKRLRQTGSVRDFAALLQEHWSK